MKRAVVRVLLGFLVIFGCLGAEIVLSQSVNAVTDATGTAGVQKALLTGVYQCYISGAVDEKIEDASQINKFSQAMNKGFKVALPSGLTGRKDNDEIDCTSFFMGGEGFKKGVLGVFGKSGDNLGTLSKDSKINFLKGMGYEPVGDKKCIRGEYTVNKNYTAITGGICLESDGSLSISGSETSNDCGALGINGVRECMGPLDFKLQKGGGAVLIGGNWCQGAVVNGIPVDCITQEGELKYPKEVKYNGNWEDFKSKVNKVIVDEFPDTFVKNGHEYTLSTGFSIKNSDEGDSLAGVYKLKGGYLDAANAAIHYLSNNTYWQSDLTFSDEEKTSFYVSTLKNWFFDGSDSGWWVCNSDSSMLNSSYVEINLDASGTRTEGCYIKTDEAVNTDAAYGFRGNLFDASGGTTLSLGQLIEAINGLTENMPEGEAIDPLVAGDVNNDPNGPDEKEKTCAGSGAAQSLGWIVCPVLEIISNAAEDIYVGYIEPSLQVQSNLFTEGGDAGLESAWSTFRNIANILFIILFLVVIVSQLTGYGIDNYGIKKILPKLIIAAVLINLSFVICEICVDISNIVGSGIKGFFDGLGNGLPGTVEISNEVTNEVAGVVGGGGNSGKAITAVTILVGVFTVIGVIANPAIILALLVSALGVLVSIFFLFILLAGRKAVIVVLTVLSPIAFILFMLPNTKKYFDKWLKLWAAMLMLYPICGLLVGGGNYTSKLLLSVNGGKGIFNALTAMLVGIIPIFFIPSVLKGSFAAMGNLGAKISGFGQKVGGGVMRGARNSELYKGLSQMGMERQTRLMAGMDKEGRMTTGRKVLGRFLSGVVPNARERNALRYKKIVSEQGSLRAVNEKDFMLGTNVDNEKTRIIASGEVNNEGDLQKGLEEALESGNRARINAYSDLLTAKGESGHDKVKKAWNNVAGNRSLGEGAAKTLADNIMANHTPTYKGGNRAFYEVMKGINGGEGKTSGGEYVTTDGYLKGEMMKRDANGKLVAEGGVAHLISKVKGETLGGMDDSAFAETFLKPGQNYLDIDGKANVGKLRFTDGNGQSLVSDWQALGESVDNALQNASNMDLARVTYLRAIREEALRQGYTQRAQDVNVVTTTGGGGRGRRRR